MNIYIIAIVVIIICIIIIIFQVYEYNICKNIDYIIPISKEDLKNGYINIINKYIIYISDSDNADINKEFKQLSYVHLLTNRFKKFGTKILSFFKGNEKLKFNSLDFANSILYESNIKCYVLNEYSKLFKLIKLDGKIYILKMKEKKYNSQNEGYINQNFPKESIGWYQMAPIGTINSIETKLVDNSEYLDRVIPEYMYDPNTLTSHYI